MSDYNYDTFHRELEELLFELCSYGSLDLKKCLDTLRDAGADNREFSQYAESFCEDIGIQLSKADICALTYEYILQEVRREIEEKIGTDILNDVSPEIWVYGNYCCTKYESSDFTPTIKVIELIASDERSKMLEWFLSEIDV